jgi:hypothetical protein
MSHFNWPGDHPSKSGLALLLVAVFISRSPPCFSETGTSNVITNGQFNSQRGPGQVGTRSVGGELKFSTIQGLDHRFERYLVDDALENERTFPVLCKGSAIDFNRLTSHKPEYDYHRD